ncbi:hypothetical protein GNI_108480 [Gregarina niphandrodes]|uniref:Reverse transcriptase RNase H-like domain-containing protein n=1 Tax=Gregarina niphandrodes TaxID=110365 RepID=A0A023B3R5_GRENI|nr:hypothetical protein GNI_108480 [Gregarina niphandrodes]EZG55794.1 hypothetical protein GNI_108480 [Gregarina niphandrodes]|eukprot:XP_011131441.1 hypothetical protein GNI_108480 [Gregarina niphandrodes]
MRIDTVLGSGTLPLTAPAETPIGEHKKDVTFAVMPPNDLPNLLDTPDMDLLPTVGNTRMALCAKRGYVDELRDGEHRERLWELLEELKDTWEDPKVAQVKYEARFEVSRRPHKVRVRHYEPQMLEELKKQVAKQLELGVIRPSKSEWAAAPHFVKKKIGEWKYPTSKKELQSFLGMCGYLRPFIPQVLPHHGAAGSGLYSNRCKATLKYPSSSLARSSTSTESRWDTRKGELFAVKWAIEKRRDYVSLSHFTVRTDHNNLWYLTSVDKGKVFLLSDYDFTIEFISGEPNNIAD